MRQATCRSVLLLVWFVLTIPSFAEPQLWGRLHAGPYAVGFRVDKPSTLKEELHIWYPAEQSRSAPMTFGDYLRLSHDLLGAAAGFEHSTVALRTTLNRAVTGKDDVLGQEKADEILGLVMKAVRNAHPERGQFPLVFWTHRYAITSAQSVLNEYLASHGFVVIFAPESAPPPMPSDLKSDAEKSA